MPIALLRAREVVMEPVREMLGSTGVSEQKWRVLRVLDEDGPQEQTAIARNACLLLPSLTRILKAMERDGLITRTEDRLDRRRSIVEIADKGRKIVLDHTEASNALSQRLTDEFGEDELRQLLDLLNRLQDISLR
ncbi:homoprotocatechuate degradation operon regulator HpaR [Sedimentitalea xiamensis]|uniref:homoprotocatechuate degradation operon regulator HpaR n=1 Tax=Sedimentitalea xiamensis TaxID=3050037 RepID=UPI00253FE4A8|nr:homoprotocatechuate degradation operon regulator HpaR [Sedimentitalea xiamensis]